MLEGATTAELKLGEMVSRDGGMLGKKDSFADATLEQVVALKPMGLLADFVYTRTITGVKPRGHPPLPNKGNLDAAKSAINGTGPATLASMCFGCLRAPTLMQPLPTASAAVVIKAPRQPVNPGLNVQSGGNVHAAQQPNASDFLKDDEWMKLALETFCISEEIEIEGCQPGRADTVTKVVLWSRLPIHIDRTLKGKPGKESNECWRFAAENMSRVMALWERGHMLRRDCSNVGATTCLLRGPQGQWIKVTSAPADLEGCYAYWDDELKIWVRCGKVAGSGRYMRVRHKEHAEGSKLLTADHRGSTFHRGHPFKPEGDGPCWGDLTCYVAAGFTRADGSVRAICGHGANPGLFCWSEPVPKAMESRKFTTAAVPLTMDQKKVHMVSYLFELAAQLCCSPKDNLSKSPAFEAMLAAFGSSDW